MKAIRQLFFGNRKNEETLLEANKGAEVMNTKTCSKCGEVKQRNEFDKNKTASDGLQSYCKDCMTEYCKAYRTKKKQDKTSKKCSQCGEVKQFSEFYKNKSKHDGLRSECRECSLIIDQGRRDKKKAEKQQALQYKNVDIIEPHEGNGKTMLSFQDKYFMWVDGHSHIISDKELAHWAGVSDKTPGVYRSTMRRRGYVFIEDGDEFNIEHPAQPEPRDAIAELLAEGTGQTYEFCLGLVKQLQKD